MRRFWVCAALTAVMVTATAGCGVRLATPQPTEPSPGVVEQIRARTVADSLDLVAQARALAATTPAEPVSAVLADVVAQGSAQATALGGVYRSGLPRPSGTAPAGTTPSAPAPTGVALLAELAAATSTAATDTDSLTDGGLARLVGSVATARGELTWRLAVALGTTAPATEPTPTGPATSAPTVPASGSPSPTATTAALPADVLRALVLAHDQAGYGLEVIAAQLRGARLTPALDAARAHRRAAETWARTGGFDGTGTDPRRAQYALPGNLTDPTAAAALAAGLERAVGDAYGAALASAPAGARAELLTGLRTATAAARDWGGAPQTFPGMAETTTGPTASTTPGAAASP